MSDPVIINALRGMTPTQRAALVLLAHAGPEGLGQGAPVTRGTLSSLVSRGLARELLGPADRPAAWRFVLRDEARTLARAALVMAQRGDEDFGAVELLRRAGLVGASALVRAA